MAMLRITNSGTADEYKWILCGQLAGPWVAELRSNWEQKCRASSGQKCVVDLSDVTSIDEGGEELLREMRNAGADFIATGVDTKHILRMLKTSGKRPLRRFLAHLCASEETKNEKSI
jgi:ABC-type transporter Mla MlaB component